MCLFGGEIWWMENFGEKMRRKTFWSVFDWAERKENKWWDHVFSPRAYQKVFSPKLRENCRKKLDIIFGQKCPYAVAYGLVHVALLHFFSFFFFFPSWCCLLFFFFFLFFDLLSMLPTLVLIFSFFFCFLLWFFFFFVFFFRFYFF